MCSGDIFLAALAIFFPPIAVWIKSGICSADSVINILLCVLGYLPGLLHAWYIISLYPETEYEYHNLPDAEGQPQGHVTYYYVDHRPSTDGLRPAVPGQQNASAGTETGRHYGTLAPQQQGPAGPAVPAKPSSSGDDEGVPPSYEQAIQGNNKVQH